MGSARPRPRREPEHGGARRLRGRAACPGPVELAPGGAPHRHRPRAGGAGAAHRGPEPPGGSPRSAAATPSRPTSPASASPQRRVRSSTPSPVGRRSAPSSATSDAGRTTRSSTSRRLSTTSASTRYGSNRGGRHTSGEVYDESTGDHARCPCASSSCSRRPACTSPPTCRVRMPSSSTSTRCPRRRGSRPPCRTALPAQAGWWLVPDGGRAAGLHVGARAVVGDRPGHPDPRARPAPGRPARRARVVQPGHRSRSVVCRDRAEPCVSDWPDDD